MTSLIESGSAPYSSFNFCNSVMPIYSCSNFHLVVIMFGQALANSRSFYETSIVLFSRATDWLSVT